MGRGLATRRYIVAWALRLALFKGTTPRGTSVRGTHAHANHTRPPSHRHYICAADLPRFHMTLRLPGLVADVRVFLAHAHHQYAAVTCVSVAPTITRPSDDRSMGRLLEARLRVSPPANLNPACAPTERGTRLADEGTDKLRKATLTIPEPLSTTRGIATIPSSRLIHTHPFRGYGEYVPVHEKSEIL
jgi:hypothetical protein